MVCYPFDKPEGHGGKVICTNDLDYRHNRHGLMAQLAARGMRRGGRSLGRGAWFRPPIPARHLSSYRRRNGPAVAPRQRLGDSRLRITLHAILSFCLTGLIQSPRAVKATQRVEAVDDVAVGLGSSSKVRRAGLRRLVEPVRNSGREPAQTRVACLAGGSPLRSTRISLSNAWARSDRFAPPG